MGNLKLIFKNLNKIAFARPEMQELSDSDHRSASAVELFVDLIYVVALGNITHVYIDHPTVDSFIQTILMIATILVMWISLTMYNQRYEMNNLYHRFMMAISMMPILILASINSFVDSSNNFIMFNINFVLFGYVFSRVFVVILWHIASFSKKRNGIYYDVLRKQVIGLTFVYLTAAALGALVAVYPENMLLLWGTAICIELFGPMLFTQFLHRKTNKFPKLHTHLRAERYLLFTILVLGEGLVLTKTNLAELEMFSGTLIMSVLLFLLIIFQLFWFYLDFYSKFAIKAKSNLWTMTFLIHTITMYLILVLVGTIVHGIFYGQHGEPHHIDGITRIFLASTLTAYYFGHIIFQLNRDMAISEEYKNLNFDVRVTSVISIVASMALCFSPLEGLPFLIVLFLILLLNFVKGLFDWLTKAEKLYRSV